jgi:hypothetical protein
MTWVLVTNGNRIVRGILSCGATSAANHIAVLASGAGPETAGHELTTGTEAGPTHQETSRR